MESLIFMFWCCDLTTTQYRLKVWRKLNALKPIVASVAVKPKAVALLWFMHCLFMPPLSVGALYLVLVLLCST